MSTHTNVILKEGDEKLFFYRHSDGYPEGTMPSLNIFMDWLKSGDIRDNTNQCAGWLVIIGAIEYNSLPKYKTTSRKGYDGEIEEDSDISTIETPKDWKVGAYEPTTGIHGDIEYLYVIDLDKKTIDCYDSWTEEGEGKHKVNISKFLTKVATK